MFCLISQENKAKANVQCKRIQAQICVSIAWLSRKPLNETLPTGHCNLASLLLKIKEYTEPY